MKRTRRSRRSVDGRHKRFSKQQVESMDSAYLDLVAKKKAGTLSRGAIGRFAKGKFKHASQIYAHLGTKARAQKSGKKGKHSWSTRKKGSKKGSKKALRSATRKFTHESLPGRSYKNAQSLKRALRKLRSGKLKATTKGRGFSRRRSRRSR